MNRTPSLMLAGLLAAALSTTAMAQSTTPEKSDKRSDKPLAVGVSQDTANKANKKAAESGDVATVVRTGPTAAEQASSAADKASDKTKKAVDKARNTDDKPSTATPKP